MTTSRYVTTQSQKNLKINKKTDRLICTLKFYWYTASIAFSKCTGPFDIRHILLRAVNRDWFNLVTERSKNR